MDNKNKEQELRELVAASGRRLVRSGLVQGTWGNISVRLDENYMVVTPSGLDYERLTPADMVVVNIHTMEWTGKLKPTSEKKLHAGILRERPEINAVIHSHPVNCSVVAAARREMPVMNDDMKKYVLGSAKAAVYALPGTKKMTVGTMEALKGRNACFMANHGVIACGADLEIAFETCRVMEESSKQFVAESAEKMSGKPLNEKTFEELFLKKIK